MTDPVIIHSYNSEWPNQFEALAAPIRAALGPLAMSVEHVGSTSVPGLAAKPIIDLVVVISSRLQLPDVLERLAGLGYVHRGDLGIPGREAFHWIGGTRHHLYVCAVDAVQLHEFLLFRDYLRSHPAEARAYAELKVKLAEQYREDRDVYSEAKTEFVNGILSKANYLPSLHQAYIVQHVHEFEDGSDNVKFIGVFSTREEAEKAIGQVGDKEGFKDHPQGFYIDRYPVNKASWIEGFVTEQFSLTEGE